MKLTIFIIIIVLGLIAGMYPYLILLFGFISFIAFVILYSNKPSQPFPTKQQSYTFTESPYKEIKVTYNGQPNIGDEDFETEYKYPSDFVSTDYWPEDAPYPFQSVAKRKAQRLVPIRKIAHRRAQRRT